MDSETTKINGHLENEGGDFKNEPKVDANTEPLEVKMESDLMPNGNQGAIRHLTFACLPFELFFFQLVPILS